MRVGGGRQPVLRAATWAAGVAASQAVLFAVLAAAAPASTGAETSAPARWCAAAPGDPRAARQVCITTGAGYAGDLCDALEIYARGADLPPGFFTRLIWRESRFDPAAISPKGAQGVAQFIPATARRRGLDDPFNPAAALKASAAFLADLRAEFGSLGAAAAAYNAGEGRLRRVIATGRPAPAETEAYVPAITGRSLSDWIARPRSTEAERAALALDPERPFHPACRALAAERRPPAALATPGPPWGVQLARHVNSGVARRLVRRVQNRHRRLLGDEAVFIRRDRRIQGLGRFYGAYLGRPTRADALRLCRRLRRAGVVCVVARL